MLAQRGARARHPENKHRRRIGISVRTGTLDEVFRKAFDDRVDAPFESGRLESGGGGADVRGGVESRHRLAIVFEVVERLSKREKELDAGVVVAPGFSDSRAQ